LSRRRPTRFRRRTGGSPISSARSVSSRSNSIFSASLAAGRGGAPDERRAWRRGVYAVIQAMSAPLSQGEIGIDRMCQLAGVSRAGYYRHWQASVPRREETGLGDAIQKLVLAHRHYGHRRIAAMLHRAGWLTNHKRAPRVVREDNLLCLRRASFVPTTTDSRHGCGSCPTRRAAALSRTLAERLRGGNTFGIVTNDEDAGLANDRELLSHYRCLLSSSVTADSFGRRPLRQAATFIAKGRTSYLPILDRLICQIVSTIFPKCLFVRMYSCAASPS
jgi:hypothetical protein